MVNRVWSTAGAGEADRELTLSASACHIGGPNSVNPGQILLVYGSSYAYSKSLYLPGFKEQLRPGDLNKDGRDSLSQPRSIDDDAFTQDHDQAETRFGHCTTKFNAANIDLTGGQIKITFIEGALFSSLPSIFIALVTRPDWKRCQP